MKKKLFFVFSLLFLFSNSLFADLWFFFPHYIKVDKVVPIYKQEVSKNTINSCEWKKKKSFAFCTEDAVILHNHISGKSIEQLNPRYKLDGEDIVYYDESSDECFNVVAELNCSEKIQADSLKKIKFYKNIAEYKGKLYVKYSNEPLWFIDIRKEYSFF